MTISASLLGRLQELATLEVDDVTGWMNVYSDDAQQILKLVEEAEILRAIRNLVAEHNVSGATLRTLLATPTTDTLQGMARRRQMEVPA